MKTLKKTVRTLRVLAWDAATRTGMIRVTTSKQTQEYAIRHMGRIWTWTKEDGVTYTVALDVVPTFDQCTCDAYAKGDGRFRCKHVDASRKLQTLGM